MTVPNSTTAPETPAPAADPTPPSTPGAIDTAPPAATPPAAPAEPATPSRTLEASLSGLDEDTRNFVLAEVSRSRKEAADARGAKTRAVNDARAEVAQSIGKALGIVDETPDPAKLTEQLSSERSRAQQAELELAIFRAASGKANAAQLLDSRSFLEKVKGLDPADPAALTAAIDEHVAANPALAPAAAADARRLPMPNPAQGGGFLPDAPPLDDQIAAAQKAGNVREVIRLNNQKLTAAAQAQR